MDGEDDEEVEVSVCHFLRTEDNAGAVFGLGFHREQVFEALLAVLIGFDLGEGDSRDKALGAFSGREFEFAVETHLKLEDLAELAFLFEGLEDFVLAEAEFFEGAREVLAALSELGFFLQLAAGFDSQDADIDLVGVLGHRGLGEEEPTQSESE